MYVPAPQTKQALDPADEMKKPAGQAKQPDPFEEKYPTGHKEHEFEEKHEEPVEQETVQEPEQALAAVAFAVVLNLPAAQKKQSATSSCKDANDAESLRNLPASQDVQADKDVVL